MKKLILTLAVILPLFSNSLFSTTIISRTKTQCIPGCNTVNRETNKYAVEDDEGNIIDWVWEVTINCSGWGVSGCPSEMVAPGEENEVDQFTATYGQLFFDYALNQISSNNLNGSLYANYLNTSTGQLWKFTATWTTVNGLETIIVTKELIS